MKSIDLPELKEWILFNQEILEKLPASSGVYIIRNKKCFGRLIGDSDILYIGKADNKKGLKHRIKFYFKPGINQRTSKRINALILGDYKDRIEISWMIIDPENTKEKEKELLTKYLKDHGELPPWNRNL